MGRREEEVTSSWSNKRYVGLGTSYGAEARWEHERAVAQRDVARDLIKISTADHITAFHAIGRTTASSKCDLLGV